MVIHPVILLGMFFLTSPMVNSKYKSCVVTLFEKKITQLEKYFHSGLNFGPSQHTLKNI